MAYSSDAMKKSYKTECDTQRTKNLIKLREEIAGLTQAEFIREVGFTKSDISNLESGEKLLSLYHIQAYRLYFKEKHNINVSVDFLMGYTDIIENRSLNIAADLGLSNDAIESLKKIKECADEDKTIKDDLDMLNFLMSDFVQFDVFISHIRQFIDNSYNIPMHYDSKVDAFVESELPDSPIKGAYFSIGRKIEVKEETHIQRLDVSIKVIESYALQCIQEHLRTWKKAYQNERK